MRGGVGITPRNVGDMPEQKKNKREAPISYRVPSALRDEFRTRVQSSGMSISAFITQAIFDRKAPRPSRSSGLDEKQLAKMLAQSAAIRDRLDKLNTNETQEMTDTITQVNEELAAIRAALLSALRRQS